MAVSKPLLTEFGIHHRLESCETYGWDDGRCGRGDGLTAEWVVGAGGGVDTSGPLGSGGGDDTSKDSESLHLERANRVTRASYQKS